MAFFSLLEKSQVQNEELRKQLKGFLAKATFMGDAPCDLSFLGQPFKKGRQYLVKGQSERGNITLLVLNDIDKADIEDINNLYTKTPYYVYSSAFGYVLIKLNGTFAKPYITSTINLAYIKGGVHTTYPALYLSHFEPNKKKRPYHTSGSLQIKVKPNLLIEEEYY